MSDFLKCPFCTTKYNLTTNIPRSSQCGGVYCSSCISDPCRICKSVHTVPMKDFLPFKDYLQKNLIMCICLKNSAFLIDGKSFLPYCSSCLKSYQKGVKVDDSEFGLYVDNIFVYFVEKFRSEKKREMADWLIEHGVKGLSDKLMTIRMAEQYLTENVCCWVHIDKPAGFVNKELQFHCGCEKNGVELTDYEECKSLINNFISKTGLTNKFLHNQLTKSQGFLSIKSIFEAKRLNRGIKPSDICFICTKNFGAGAAYQLSTKNHQEDNIFQIVCIKCKEQIVESENEISGIVEKKLEYSITCSLCSNNFLILYKIPLEDQILVPFKIYCGHNLCRNCLFKARDGKVFCGICQLSFKFNPKLNMTLLSIQDEKDIYCDSHHMPIIRYSFDPVLTLFCEKCNCFKPNDISELYVPIKFSFKHLIRFLESNDLLPNNTISKLKNLILAKHKLESLSDIFFENWFNSSDSIDLCDTSSQESIDDFAFCMSSSNSIVITSIEFAATHIGAKLRVSIFKNGKVKPIKIFYFSLGSHDSTIDLKQKGYLPLIKNEFYEFAVTEVDGGYTGFKIKNPTIAPQGFELKFFYSSNDEIAQYSLIKSIKYLTLPN